MFNCFHSILQKSRRCGERMSIYTRVTSSLVEAETSAQSSRSSKRTGGSSVGGGFCDETPELQKIPLK